MIELRRQVERIVRPIQGSQRRKDRMREELLAHLTRLYEEEAAVPGTAEQTSLTRAIARFGDPVQLRGELQATVPRFERVFCTPLPTGKWNARRPGESTTAFLRRVVPRVTLINAVLWFLFVAFLHGVVRRPNNVNLSGFIWLHIAYVVTFPMGTYGPILLGGMFVAERKRLATASGAKWRAGLRMAGYAVGASLCISGTFVMFMLLFNRAAGFEVFTPFLNWCVVGCWTLAFIPVFALQVRELRRFEEWTGLDLDDLPSEANTAIGG